MQGPRQPYGYYEQQRMKHYKQVNLERALVNPNENWMFAKLEQTGFKWKRQVLRACASSTSSVRSSG